MSSQESLNIGGAATGAVLSSQEALPSTSSDGRDGWVIPSSIYLDC